MEEPIFVTQIADSIRNESLDLTRAHIFTILCRRYNMPVVQFFDYKSLEQVEHDRPLVLDLAENISRCQLANITGFFTSVRTFFVLKICPLPLVGATTLAC